MDGEKVLCIIDMQKTGLRSSMEEVIQRIIEEIKYARKNKYKIVVVELYQCGFTLDSIVNALKGYPYFKVIKEHLDGSREIMFALRDLEINRIEVCGRMTTACVAETVAGLRRKLPPEKVVVIADATYPHRWKEEYADIKQPAKMVV
jgi:nicotinamidase-related amidase